MRRKFFILIFTICFFSVIYISCDDISTPRRNPREPRAVLQASEKKDGPPPAPLKKPKSKDELIKFYFFIKNTKELIETKADPIVKAKQKGEKDFLALWPDWKYLFDRIGAKLIWNIDGYSPVDIEPRLPPEHLQVKLWLTAKDLKKEFEMYNNYFSFGGPLDPEISKNIDNSLKECYKLLEDFHDSYAEE